MLELLWALVSPGLGIEAVALMDYEQRIKELEEGLRHEQAQRRLMTQHLDAHDTSLMAVKQIQLDTAQMQLKTEASLQQLEAAQLKTEAMLQNLIELLTRSHTNGGSKDA